MYIGLWGFLSISVILGFLFIMFLIYTKFEKKQTQLKIDAIKNQDKQSKLESSTDHLDLSKQSTAVTASDTVQHE